MYRWFGKCGRLFFLAGKTTLRYAQDNLGVKKVSAPSKNPLNCPIMSFAQENKMISPTFKREETERKEREREREERGRARKREREREQEQEQEREQERERERERERDRKCGRLYF